MKRWTKSSTGRFTTEKTTPRAKTVVSGLVPSAGFRWPQTLQ